MRLRLAACAAIFLFAAFLFAPLAGAEQPAAPSALVDRVGNTGFVLLRAESFKALDPRQQALAYWLTQASIAIDPIIYDQLSPYGLRQKRLLEEIVAHPEGIDPAAMGKITDFAKLFWGNRGNHNENTAQKFLPTFTFDELKQAALTAQRHGAMKTAYGDLPPLATPAQLNRELSELKASLFDPSFQPMMTAKSPEGGKDIIQASSNNFYSGVSLADLKDFKEQHPLTSRVVKGKDGKLHEEVYRAGTPDGRIPPGLYATYLRRANQCSRESARGSGTQAGAGDCRSGSFLPDRRLPGLAQVRRRLGAGQFARGLRQRLHRDLPRRARRQGQLAELRLGDRQAAHRRHGEAGRERPILRAEERPGTTNTRRSACSRRW